MKAFFERLKAKGKPGKVALVAIIVFLPDLLAFGKAAWMASQVFPRAALPRSSKTWSRRSIWPRVSWQCLEAGLAFFRQGGARHFRQCLEGLFSA